MRELELEIIYSTLAHSLALSLFLFPIHSLYPFSLFLAANNGETKPLILKATVIVVVVSRQFVRKSSNEKVCQQFVRKNIERCFYLEQLHSFQFFPS